MTENRKNWLYPEASGLYFPHDGFVMRATDGKQYDYEEECELLNEYHKEYNECRNDVLRLEKENEQLKEQIADLENSFDICKHYKETYGDEIVHIKTTIKTMMETERTELGRSVLKQLWEQLQ